MDIYQNPTVAGILKIFAQFLPFILIIVIFYFFLIRPQQKQQQMVAKMRSNLKTGDRVITRGGIIGTIFEIKQNELVIQMHDGAKIEILKDAIVALANPL